MELLFSILGGLCLGAMIALGLYARALEREERDREEEDAWMLPPAAAAAPQRGLHVLVRRTAQRPADGRHSLKLGLAAGYWPCLRAPYLQISLGTRIIDIWYGDRSHNTPA